MKQRFFLYIITFLLLFFSISITNSASDDVTSFASNTVWPYSSMGECSTVREDNNNKDWSYSEYDRSECYQFEGSFQYNVCKKGEQCITTLSNTKENNENTNLANPFKDKIFESNWKEYTFGMLKEKVSAIIKKIEKNKNDSEKIIALEKFIKKINSTKGKEKYKTNSLVKNLVWYIKFEIQAEVNTLKEKVNSNQQTDWVSDFLCDISWGCESNTSTWTVNSTVLKCSWTKPTWEWIILSQDIQSWNYTSWNYSEKTTSYYNCSWKCDKWYEKKWNTCTKKILKTVKCWILNWKTLKKLPSKTDESLCSNGKINSLSEDYPWYYWSCKWEENKVVYCKAKMSKVCSQEYKPVCATDFNNESWFVKWAISTVSSKCMAGIYWAKILYEWECKEVKEFQDPSLWLPKWFNEVNWKEYLYPFQFNTTSWKSFCEMKGYEKYVDWSWKSKIVSGWYYYWNKWIKYKFNKKDVKVFSILQCSWKKVWLDKINWVCWKKVNTCEKWIFHWFKIDTINEYLWSCLWVNWWNTISCKSKKEEKNLWKISLNKYNFTEYKIFQRDKENSYTFDLNWTYTWKCISVEASFANSKYSIIDTNPNWWKFSWKLKSSIWQWELKVRCKYDKLSEDKAIEIWIWDIYLIAGQSNSYWYWKNLQKYLSTWEWAKYYPSIFYKWKWNIANNLGRTKGSVRPIVWWYIVKNAEIPVWFIFTPVWWTRLVSKSQWSKEATVDCLKNSKVTCYNRMIDIVSDSKVNSIKSILWFQWESDVNYYKTITVKKYKDALEKFLIDAKNELPGNPELISGVIWPRRFHIEDIYKVRLWTMATWENENIKNGPQMYDIHIIDDGYWDNAHYFTDDEIQTLWFRWWKAIEQHYYNWNSWMWPTILSAIKKDTTTIDLTFSSSSNLKASKWSDIKWKNILSNEAWKIKAWWIEEDIIKSIEIINNNTVRIKLSKNVKSKELTITYADGNDWENRNILADSNTWNILEGPSYLPANPFVDFEVEILKLDVWDNCTEEINKVCWLKWTKYITYNNSCLRDKDDAYKIDSKACNNSKYKEGYFKVWSTSYFSNWKTAFCKRSDVYWISQSERSWVKYKAFPHAMLYYGTCSSVRDEKIRNEKYSKINFSIWDRYFYSDWISSFCKIKTKPSWNITVKKHYPYWMSYIWYCK